MSDDERTVYLVQEYDDLTLRGVRAVRSSLEQAEAWIDRKPLSRQNDYEVIAWIVDDDADD